MTAVPPHIPGPASVGDPDTGTLGGHTARQLLGLGGIAGLSAADSKVYARTLVEALGPVAERPLRLPPADSSFISDDHTPVEFSLSFEPGAAPTLRVLLEPGAGAPDPAENGRTGLRVLRGLADRWGFSTARLDELEDLFFPPAPKGPLALWCALELRPGGVPRVKAYLNPAANGAKHAAGTVRKALKRLGHRHAFRTLPDGDRHLFFALDLGDWAEPRVKVYLAHHELSAPQAAGLTRMADGPDAGEIEEFLRITTGAGAETGGSADAGRDADSGIGADGRPARRPMRRPLQSCHAFTDRQTSLPTGFTLYVPVRDHLPHDGEALARATDLLKRYGMDPAPLHHALAAVTSRQPEDGVGLVAYLGLAHQEGRPPRIMTYISSEAYEVRPPALPRAEAAAAAGR
ncbi:tryptophan dimethylallyltransferase family protein [Streptomyces antibioticus]|uniref:tryptophan dimethylallyltransferase family protein n=1 Tax=Streptomyces antibioticus TaxID=1890 RepID=UPI003D70FFF3